MRRFKSTQQAQRFLTVHAAVYNLFNLGRHVISAKNYRFFRMRAFASWNCAGHDKRFLLELATAEQLTCQYHTG
jgi:putative transposase